MHPEIKEFNEKQSGDEKEICELLADHLIELLPEANYKIWHKHPVWFLDENPIVGYSKQKAGIRLMFWSGASFNEEKLKPGTGKFKDASIFYTEPNQIIVDDLKRWVDKSRSVQWDYQNIYKRKGKLERLK